MKIARFVEIILGAWLFLSTFLWPHPQPHSVETWSLAIALMTFSIIAMRVDWVRYLNTAVAALLLVLTLGAGLTDKATLWNNSIVALAIFCLTFVGRPRGMALAT